MPTSIGTLTLSCSTNNGVNPTSADKLGAQYGRALRDWATHIADYGYAVGTLAEVRLGKGDNYGLPTGPYALVDELICADACQYPPACTDLGGHQGLCTSDLGRSLNHAATAKFVLNNDCYYADWDKMWAWMGRPPLTLSGNCSVSILQGCLSNSDCAGLSPSGQTCVKPSSCNVFKDCASGNCAANLPANQAYEAFRCYQEAFVKPQIDEWLADARAYGRCSNDATRPCSSNAACTGGGTCTGSYLTNTCASQVFNVIGNVIASNTLTLSCLDGESKCLTQGWYNCYNQWDSLAMHNNCSTSSTSGTWKLAFSGTASHVPQCPTDSTAGGTAQVDCNTYFQWCKDATRRLLPAIYGTRQKPPGPAIWEP